MENLRNKYGQWAFVLGATDGIGKSFCEYFARRQMDVILVGRRAEKLNELAKSLEKDYKVNTIVLPQDLSTDNAAETLIEKVKDLDIGVLNYVACYHTMGRYFKKSYEEHKKVLNVNVNTYSKLLYHFSRVFFENNRGAIVTMSSLTAFTGNPFNAEYGATKSYMQIVTESLGYEFKDTNVDVIVITAGSTKTPTWLQNQPKGEAAKNNDNAMFPEEVVEDGMAQLGKKWSHIAGEKNRTAYDKYIKQMTRDEVTATFGGFFTHEA